MYQVNDINEITSDFVKDTVEKFNASTERKKFESENAYYLGKNPPILNRKVPDDSGPDNRIPVSYARRIVNLVVGYMYRPGLINYSSEDEGYLDKLREVFDDNEEPLKSEQVGKQVTTHGVGYEFHYVKGQMDSNSQVKAAPRFIKLPVTEVIPIYDFAIEPELLAFIRYYAVDETEEGKADEETLAVFVFDSARWVEYRKTKKGLILVREGRHFYGQVPLVVFRNNEELLGDFDAAQPLIDAYDVLMSDSMNEFDRFAWAYLILKGMSLSQADADNLKRVRMFESLSAEAGVEFLTKEIDTTFIEFMADWIRDEIHRQSGIPNLEDYESSSASGKTMSRFIYLMELFTDPKESYFTEGLMQRIELVTAILGKTGTQGEAKEVNIIMNRNMPDASLEQAEIFNKYTGFVSQRTLMDNFADFVDDVDQEIEQLAEETPVFDVEDVPDVEDE